MKKGRHRRFEEARALKRSHEVDLNDLFDSISDAPEGEHKPEHDAWADLAEEWDTENSDDDSAETGAGESVDAAVSNEDARSADDAPATDVEEDAAS